MILLCLLLVFSGVLLGPLVHRLVGRSSPWVLAALPLGAFALLAARLDEVADGLPVHESYTWVEALGFSLQFNLDGLALLFGLLITGIGTLIVIYGGSYLEKDPQLPRFYSFLFLFMTAMLGVVLSDNIFALFVFWELTSLSSYLLIGYKHGYAESRRSALQALLVTGSGGLALMAGLILMAGAAGSPVISSWVPSGAAFVGSPYFGAILVLVLLGAFTKSAQFPFHFWLPNAMAAPTPVSAYLHSATMVKAGVYLLARLNPYFFASTEWHYALTLVGGLTMLTGALWALFQTDLKKILAYTTISALGVLVFSIGIGSPQAVQGAVVFLLAHALYKGALFMIAGNVDHFTGSRDVDRLAGLYRKMRGTGAAAALAVLSFAGFPLLLGFVTKELLYEATLHHPAIAVPMTAVLFITSGIFAGLAILIGWKLFFSREQPVHMVKEVPDHPVDDADRKRLPVGMVVGPVVLALLGLLIGVVPALGDKLLGTAAANVSQEAVGMHLAVWHGFTPVLLLSVITLVTGVLVYRSSGRFRGFGPRLQGPERFGPEAVYYALLHGVTGFAEKLTTFLQNGHLRNYIKVIMFTLFGLAGYAVWHYDLLHISPSLAGVDPYEILLGLLVIVAVGYTVMAWDRLAAIVVLGVVGYGVAVFYAVYGGMDLAMTQFLIETLTVVVFVYVLYKLPGYMTFSRTGYRYRDGFIALLGGATMTTLILLVTNYPLTSELKLFFAENSYPLAKGRNVVNVILVDFRAMDTLGEIVVLSIAALGVMALMKLKLTQPRSLPKVRKP
jgi:multicomponent Na+:H+ antiporter subunit A